MNKRGSIAILQILILIIGIVAIGYALGSQVKEISANPTVASEPVFKILGSKGGSGSNEIITATKKLTITSGKETYTIDAGTPIVSSADGKYYANVLAADNTQKSVQVATGDISSLVKGGQVSSSNTYFYTEALKDGGTSYTSIGPKAIEGGIAKELSPGVVETKFDNYADYVNAQSQATGKGEPGFLEAGGWFGKGTISGAIGSSVLWASVVFGIVALVDALAPDSWQPYTDALSYSLPGGTLAGGLVYNFFSKGGYAENNAVGQFINSYGGAGVWGIGTGVVVAAAIFFFMYEDVEFEKITFTCYPWDAPTGGSNCEKCNAQSLPCSEYQCKSLGQACQLQNPNTATPICTWVNKGDVVAPVITLWEEVLTAGLRYNPESAKSPDDKGVRIINPEDGKTGCIKAYTPLVFGIKTDEPSRCKIDVLGKQNFSDMAYYFGGNSLFAYNHTHIMSLPGVDTGENQSITLKNDGELKLYVRCQDANGNYNVGNWVFRMCVDEGPDTTAPQILGTNMANGMPIAYNVSSLPVELYTNEPAECRFDRLDKGEFDKMDNIMSCSRTAIEMNAQMVYTCKGTLTGIKSGSGMENNYYFKCRDKPQASKDRNTNAENYKFTILGTQPLILDNIGPNGTIKDNVNPVSVKLTAETSAGFSDGESACYYSLSGKQSDYVKFFATDSYTHSQELFLSPNKYNISIKCIDLGGNSATAKANFTIEADTAQPRVVRIFHEETNLKLITDESAECVYSTNDCNYQFKDGVVINPVTELEHYTEWKVDQTMYIKCKDKYENQPNANTCTVEVKPYESI